MTKIMLVEDDNNLREIYEARLTAEGYTIVSAQDGEAALAIAAQERPDLVITDVMMPKISGFEMLDILRNTENLRDVKVIMLTALGQAEDNARANTLGADRYLVKSQVTLEDIVKAAHDLLDGPAQSTATPVDVTAATTTAAVVSNDEPHIPPAPGVAFAPTGSTPSTPVSPDLQDWNFNAPAEPAVAATPVAEAPSYEPALPVVAPDTPMQEAAVSTPIETPPAMQPVAEPVDVIPAPSFAMPTPQPVTPPSDTSQPSVDDTQPQDNLVMSDTTTVPSDDTQVADPTAPVASDDQAQPVSEPTGELSLPTPDSSAPEAELAAAPSEADEESAIRGQIDQYLQTQSTDGLTYETGEQAPVAAEAAPEATLPVEPVPSFDTPAAEQAPTVEPTPTPADTAPAANAETPEVAQYHLQPIDDQNDAEYAKDDSTPDMGEMSLHEPGVTDGAVSPQAEVTPEPTPPSVPGPDYDPSADQSADTTNQYDMPVTAPPADPGTVAPATPEAAPMSEPQTAPAVDATPPVVAPAGYPSQPYQMPVMPGADVNTPSAPVSTDAVVSNAVDDMVASTQPPQTPTAENAPVAPPAPEQSAPSSDDGPSRRRVIQPLNTERPDIHQLLAAEEAKNGAVQAGMQPPAPQSNGVNALGQPWQQLPVDNQPRPDRYRSDVDPNSISL